MQKNGGKWNLNLGMRVKGKRGNETIDSLVLLLAITLEAGNRAEKKVC